MDIVLIASAEKGNVHQYPIYVLEACSLSLSLLRHTYRCPQINVEHDLKCRTLSDLGTFVFLKVTAIQIVLSWAA